MPWCYRRIMTAFEIGVLIAVILSPQRLDDLFGIFSSRHHSDHPTTSVLIGQASATRTTSCRSITSKCHCASFWRSQNSSTTSFSMTDTPHCDSNVQSVLTSRRRGRGIGARINGFAMKPRSHAPVL
jgi:hypothetical protein